MLLRALAQVLSDADRHSEAVVASAAAIAAEPTSPVGYRLHAISLSNLGNHEEARQAAETSLELAPLSPQSFNTQAIVSYHAGEFAAGADAASRAISLEPDDPDSHVYLARCSQSAGDPATAQQALEEALRLRPDHALALRMRAAFGVETQSDVDRLRGLLNSEVLDPTEGRELPSLLVLRAWRMLILPWVSLVVSALCVGVVATITQWGDWRSSSLSVHIAAAVCMIGWQAWFIKLRRSLPPRERAALRLTIRRQLTLLPAVVLLAARLAILFLVAVTGVSFWLIYMVPVVIAMPLLMQCCVAMLMRRNTATAPPNKTAQG
jgi:hypothetical protein